MESTKILFVEDDKAMAKVLKRYLDARGFDVIHCIDAEEGIKVFGEERAKLDLCIFDIMMPYKDGFTLAQEIRKADQHIPILFVSSKSLSEDKIRAFKLGADDYITKPFNVEELTLRIQAVLSRYRNQSKATQNEETLPDRVAIGRYVLDIPFQKLIFDGEEKRLTAREADLLRFLYIRRNTLIKREYILQEIWGDDDYYKGRSLDVFMSRLRKYLKEDPNIEILNVHAVGFKFIISQNRSTEKAS